MSEVEKEPQVPDNNDIGEEGEEEGPTVSIAPQEEKEVTTGAYKPLQFNVKDVKKVVPDIPKPESEDDGKQAAAASVFTKEEARFFAELIWNTPGAVLGDYITPDKKLVNQWGDQLFFYCERKGINLYDYVFAELGLVMSTGVIVTSMAAKYKAHKKELEKADEAESE